MESWAPILSRFNNSVKLMNTTHPTFFLLLFTHRNLVSELRDLLEHYIAQEEVDRDNPDAPMTGLRSFSLITHSFGVTTISGVLGTLICYLNGLLKYTAAMPPVEGGGGMYNPGHHGHHNHGHRYVPLPQHHQQQHQQQR